MQNFVQPGNVQAFTAGATISSGDVVVIGTKIGVAVNDVANGASGLAAIGGVYTLPKLTGALTINQVVYWNTTGPGITASSTGNTLAGTVWAAAGTAATTVQVLVNNNPAS